MASSYTSNSGIEKPAEGDQTGEWGDTVNTNMDIIDRSINGVGAITLSGTTHTLTTTDGTLSDGMYKVLVLGGSPSGTNTITIAPNSADKVYIVVNGSGQTATFTQGSGANVSVLNGDSKIIYADGAGSGAAVVDITANLSFSSVNIDGGTIDGTVIGGASAAAGTFTTVTASGEIDGASLDISGNADIDGTLEADAMTLNGTAITTTATLSTGISNTNVPVFTSGVADDDFLRVAGTSIEGRSAAEVLSDIGASAAAGSGSIVTTGALDSGSITSGFGTINNGSSAITTTGLISGGSLDIDDVVINGSTIGHTDDTDLITVANGVATVAGEVSMTTLDIGGTNVTSTATELNKLDGATVTTTEINYLDITTLGTSEASKAVTVDSSGDLIVPDSDKFKFGAGSDMQLYHDGTNSYITNGTGILKIATETSGIAINIGHGTSEVTFGDNVTVTGDFTVNGTTTTINTTNLTVTDPLVKFGQGYTGTAYDEGFIVTRGNGSASNTANKGFIWDESADEFAAIACNTEDGTTAGNVTINSYADLQVDKLTGGSLDISGDVDVDGTLETDALSIASTAVTSTAAELNYLDITTLGTTQASKAVTTDSNGDVVFPDGDKINFGTGSDLQIFHDGSDSYVKDAGTGRLVVETDGTDVSLKAGAENMLVAAKDGAVTLYYDNVAKLATTATGADITGSVTITDADSGEPRILIVDTNADASAAHLDFQKDSASPADNDQVGIIRFISDNDAGQTTIVAQVIANITDVTDGTENGRLGFETMVDGTIAERMTITGEGKVGIGNNAPASTLDVLLAGDGNISGPTSGVWAARVVNEQDSNTYNGLSVQNRWAADSAFILEGAMGWNGSSTGYFPVFTIDGLGQAIFKPQRVETMRIASDGKVGIGTSAPKNRLQSTGAGVLNAPSLGSAPANAPLYLTNNDAAYGLVVGSHSSDGHVWFQAQRTDGTATAYNITLNEAGGNVGIGTSSPTGKLTVSSDIDVLGSNFANVEFTGASVNGSGVYTGLDSGGGYVVNVRDSGYIGFSTTNAERMRIAADGKVSIGESSTTARLDVHKSSVVAAELATATNGHFFTAQSDDNTDAFEIYQQHGSNTTRNTFVVTDNHTGSKGESFLVRGDGRVGIGISAPSYDLHVKGSVGIQGADDANEGGQIDLIGGTSYTGYGKQIDIFQTALRFFGPNSWTASFFSTTGGQTVNLECSGALSKGSGSFKIDHPLESKKDTHHLVHSFIEGPQADLIYRGKVDLVGGTATINIDTAANITDGTFVLLNREVQCFTTNETGWTAIKGSVSGNILTITAQDNTCTDTISWMVIGERKDPHMYGIDWTDDDGKVITEPLKPEE